MEKFGGTKLGYDIRVLDKLKHGIIDKDCNIVIQKKIIRHI